MAISSFDPCFFPLELSGEREIPELFTYPFNYDPHPLVQQSAQILKNKLMVSEDLGHDFELGKMFGVLVVQGPRGLGFLASFSGRLGGRTDHQGFVPPVFSLLEKNNFFSLGEKKIEGLTARLEKLEKHPTYFVLKAQWNELLAQEKGEISRAKEKQKEKKQERKKIREEKQGILSSLDFEKLDESLRTQSLEQHYALKDQLRFFKEAKSALGKKLNLWEKKKKDLEKKRACFSSKLQQKIFRSFRFLNAKKQRKNLLDLFPQDTGAPAGAGECAAPRLLQYAYLRGYQPLALGEFWWGEPSPSRLRLPGHFYPACKSKCLPILTHMLRGLVVAPDPLSLKKGGGRIKVLHQEPSFGVIEKPPGLLSVPGKKEGDSVYRQVQEIFPQAQGPLILHRLDMDTSGLMIIPFSLQAYRKLQKQFFHHRVEKTYWAILDGFMAEEEGEISLPLRGDLDHRPMQMVCYKQGKAAVTRFRVLKVSAGKTWVELRPETGRTHQLRVHCAHPLGLGLPILGDDLYGSRDQRLFLQAKAIEFFHPETGEKMSFHLDSDFFPEQDQ